MYERQTERDRKRQKEPEGESKTGGMDTERYLLWRQPQF